MSSAPVPGDHSRKSSVTISAAGASGYMPNGGPVGKSTGSNGLRFGAFNPDGTPAMADATPQMSQPSNSLAVNAPNPRITSPMSSPSPIPQPPASGGRPPSAFQGQGNNVNFGSINGEDPNVSNHYPRRCAHSLTQTQRQLRPGGIPQGLPPTGSQTGHLRRESSQSTHSGFSNQAMGPAQGRGGYPPQAGRGRGSYGAPYSQQIPYSPNPNPNSFRPNPNQSRGGQNMNPGYQQRGQSLAPFPPSPHPVNRSPALPNAQPVHHQQGQMPIGSPMYPQHYGGYPPNMGPQVNPQSSLPLHINHHTPELRRAQISLPGLPRNLPTPDFSPVSGNFEQYLTSRTQAPYGMQQGFVDPQLAAYYQQYNLAQGMYMPPGSPRPQQQHQQMGQQQYFPGQYGSPQQPQPMSRTSSAMSASDRPGSTMGRPQPPSATPTASQAPAPSRQANSPAPKPSSFQKPQRKAALVIKDPNTGSVMDFAKQVVSPAPKSSPANVSSTPPLPPPRTGSQPEVQHHRTDSKSVKTDEEKRNDMRDAIAKKMEADKVEEKRKQEEAEEKVAEERKAAEAQALKEKEEADAKQQEAAKAQMEAENAEKKAKAEAEEAEKAANQAKEDAEEKARKEKEEDEEFARIEAEMERQEREAEERYQKKKQAEKEEQARKEAEAAKMADEDMKKAEREAEEAEEARIKKLEAGEDDESQKERTDLFAALKKEAPGTPTSEDTPAAETTEESGTATPVSEAPMPPPARVAGAKPKPAALKLETTKQVEAPQRSAQLTSLLSARRLLNINDVSYPSGFASPNPSLNTNAPPGKFNYDRNFLMQFRGVFVEKPSDDWESSIKQIMGDTAEPSSARSASTRSNNPPMGAMGQRQTSVNRAPMGGFQAQQGRTLPPGTTSQDRFKQATSALQAPPGQRPMPNPFGQFVGNRPGGLPMAPTKSMERNPSSAGMGGHPHSPRGNASQRGGSTRGSKGGKPRESEKDAKNMPLTVGVNLKPIEVSATGWKPRSVGQGATGLAGPAPGGDGHMAPDVVQRKVKSNLNKMTPNNFMKISEQILLIAGQSKDETDGRTLRQVIQLTFEKATDEAHWAQMYAEFCKRMLEAMNPEIKDEGIVHKNGQVVAGGALFRKYLLNRCQTEFERGWKTDLPNKPEGESEEAVMLSDEYYIAAAAKRRGLGLVRFIGELYKLGMLTERIMHQCVHKLVDYEGMPDEAEVESLTSLLKTIGQNLDSNERGIAMMDAYFTRIATMVNTEGLPSRLRFMLMVSI